MPNKLPPLVDAHEKLRHMVLRDGVLTLGHIAEVKKLVKELTPDLKTVLNKSYEWICKSDRLEVRKVGTDNVGVVAKRTIVANSDLVRLHELKGHASHKVSSNVNLSLAKYKSVRGTGSKYKRNGKYVKGRTFNFLVGPLAFVNHACYLHLNCITVSNKVYSELDVVRTIRAGDEITNHYGFKNDYCQECKNNK